MTLMRLKSATRAINCRKLQKDSSSWTRQSNGMPNVTTRLMYPGQQRFKAYFRRSHSPISVLYRNLRHSNIALLCPLRSIAIKRRVFKKGGYFIHLYRATVQPWPNGFITNSPASPLPLRPTAKSGHQIRFPHQQAELHRPCRVENKS